MIWNFALSGVTAPRLLYRQRYRVISLDPTSIAPLDFILINREASEVAFSHYKLQECMENDDWQELPSEQCVWRFLFDPSHDIVLSSSIREEASPVEHIAKKLCFHYRNYLLHLRSKSPELWLKVYPNVEELYSTNFVERSGLLNIDMSRLKLLWDKKSGQSIMDIDERVVAGLHWPVPKTEPGT